MSTGPGKTFIFGKAARARYERAASNDERDLAMVSAGLAALHIEQATPGTQNQIDVNQAGRKLLALHMLDPYVSGEVWARSSHATTIQNLDETLAAAPWTPSFGYPMTMTMTDETTADWPPLIAEFWVAFFQVFRLPVYNVALDSNVVVFKANVSLFRAQGHRTAKDTAPILDFYRALRAATPEMYDRSIRVDLVLLYFASQCLMGKNGADVIRGSRHFGYHLEKNNWKHWPAVEAVCRAHAQRFDGGTNNNMAPLNDSRQRNATADCWSTLIFALNMLPAGQVGPRAVVTPGGQEYFFGLEPAPPAEEPPLQGRPVPAYEEPQPSAALPGGPLSAPSQMPMRELPPTAGEEGEEYEDEDAAAAEEGGDYDDDDAAYEEDERELPPLPQQMSPGAAEQEQRAYEELQRYPMSEEEDLDTPPTRQPPPTPPPRLQQQQQQQQPQARPYRSTGAPIACQYHDRLDRAYAGACPSQCVASRLGLSASTTTTKIGSSVGTTHAASPAQLVAVAMASVAPEMPRSRDLVLRQHGVNASARPATSALQWTPIADRLLQAPIAARVGSLDEIDAMARHAGWASAPAPERIARFATVYGSPSVPQTFAHVGWQYSPETRAKLVEFRTANPTMSLRSMQVIASSLAQSAGK